MKEFNLDNKPKIKSGFRVPENYFENFSEKVIQQLPYDEKKVYTLNRYKKNWFLTAAAIILISFTIITLYLLQNNTNELNSAELESYIIDNSTISQDDIVELLDENDLKNMNVEFNLDNITSEAIELENIDIEQNL